MEYVMIVGLVAGPASVEGVGNVPNGKCCRYEMGEPTG